MGGGWGSGSVVQGGVVAVVASPWEEWSQNYRLVSQTQRASAKIGTPCSIQWWKAIGALSAGWRWKPLETNPPSHFFSLRGKAPVLCLHLHTLGNSEGGAVQTGVKGGENGVGGTGERLREMVVGFSGLGYTCAPQQPTFLKRVSPSQGTIHYLTL